jgi:acetoin utilization protein AcuB
MIAQELIIDTVPPILASESCEKALIWMDEFKVSHLPVVEGVNYLGLVSDDMILDSNDADVEVGKMNLISSRPYVYAYQHIYEVMKLMADMNISVVPILDKNENYLGLTTAQHLMSVITSTVAVNQSGAVIVLEMNENDYSMSQLSQLIEGNDCKILSSYVTSSVDSTKIEVTLKLNKKEISGVLQTLHRYEFNVKETYAGNKFEEDLQDRFDSLMRFLDI